MWELMSQEETDKVLEAMNSFGIKDPEESKRVVEVMRKRSRIERFKYWFFEDLAYG